MKKTLTVDLSELEQVGNENKEALREISQMANTFLAFIMKHVPRGMTLLLCCKIWASGDFARYRDTSFESPPIFIITKGAIHDRITLLHFCGLINDGFLSALTMKLREETHIIRKTVGRARASLK